MFKTRFKSCILLLLIVVVISNIQMVEAASYECPENEFYTDCGDSCQTECATLNKPCLIRRDANGKCVPIEQCAKKCCQ